MQTIWPGTGSRISKTRMCSLPREREARAFGSGGGAGTASGFPAGSGEVKTPGRLCRVFHQTKDILRHRCLEANLPARNRMHKFQTQGVERLPVNEVTLPFTIERIPDDRMMNVRHMYPDLVRASGLKTN